MTTHSRNVAVFFEDNGLGKHLQKVVFQGKLDLENVTAENYKAEVKTLVEMIENIFGIKFKREWTGKKEDFQYGWEGKGEFITIFFCLDSSYSKAEFVIRTDLIGRLDAAAKEGRKKTIVLDGNAGADDL